MADSDLDPQAFLKTVRDLSDKRQKEDNERYERLEAQILQDRNARLERKLERERSLSPEKTPQSTRSIGARTPVNGTPPTLANTPPHLGFDGTHEEGLRGRAMSPLGTSESTTPVERPSSPSKASPSSAMPSRANTMSWQRRPTSGIRSRPLSMLAPENNAARTSPVTSPGDRPTSRDDPSRQDIAQALGSKDLSFFRQTADRGVGSAAYRRNKDEELADIPTDKRKLPGLTRELPARPSAQISPTKETSSFERHSRSGSVRNSAFLPSTSERPEEQSETQPEEPTRTESPTTSPEAEKAAFGRSMPSMHGRMTSDRPPSPTKGMGGFVQSAMLKRNDSVNKRWSAQPAGGLSRQDSTASIRSGLGSVRNGLAGSYSMPKLDPSQGSAEPESRPGSSHSTISSISNLTLQDPSTKEAPSRSMGSLHGRSKSMASFREPPQQPEVRGPFSPPLSPSKRFSPTKSSWLESALARPESPRPSPAHSTQPSWMAEINKAKQQRNGAEPSIAHDDGPTEVAAASTKAYLPQTARDTESFEPLGLRRSPLKDSSVSDKSSRNVTPPTRTKPAVFASKPVQESATSNAVLTDKRAQPSKRADIERKPADASVTSSKPVETPVSTPTATSPKLGPVVRSKPETPPKKDFRSTLKSRQDVGGQAPSAQPEFKNALGNLRKTQTEKYVAPDLLKNNILQGKAGLSLTDGPQKTQRKDELKESLLKRKEEIKARITEGTPEEQRKVSPVPPPVTPEALMRKKQLGRSESVHSMGAVNPRRDITPEALARHRTLKAKPVPNAPEKPSKLSDTPAHTPFNAKSAARQSETSKQETSSEPSEEPSTAFARAPEPVTAPVATRASAAPQSSKFADRFNPALAGVLARGPPAVTKHEASSSASMSIRQLPGDDAPSSHPGNQLTHMTKSRAKGPKRRKPNVKEAISDDIPRNITPTRTETSPAVMETSTGIASPLQPPPKSAAVRAVSLKMSTPAEKDRPTTPTKSASMSLMNSSTPEIKVSPSVHKSALPSVPSSAHYSRQFLSEGKPAVSSVNMATSRTASSNTSVEARVGDDKENSEGPKSVKSAATKWGTQQTPISTPKPMTTKQPSKEDEDAVMRSANLLSSSPLRYKPSHGLGLGISASPSNSPGSSKYPLSPPHSAGLPPKPAKSSRSVSNSLQEALRIRDSHDTMDLYSTMAGKIIVDHLGSIPESDANLEIDTQACLEANADSATIKTLRKSIQQISGDGKLSPLPAQEEHVLYESSIYVVTHVFGSTSGARMTDVFLWAGATVSESAVEDAQLFAKRVAKEASTGSRATPSVTVVRQGREPAALFQALGGIVIVRRGSRAEAATRGYMLCGRPHVGQVAFDEVDMSAESLCSAFPFIVVNPVTIQNSHVYLWKGSGCGPKPIGSARLISMDLNGTSSDVIEVEQGAEPTEFLSLLSIRNSRSTSPTISTLHGIDETLSPRLFRIDALPPRRASSSIFSLFTGGGRQQSVSRPTSSHRPPSSNSMKSPSLMSPPLDSSSRPQIVATELAPFSQSDLEPEHIYILDCIGKIYVLPGPLLSSSQNTFWTFTFPQALLFASEYAILAAGVQDRRCVPTAEVVFGTLPEDARRVFRYWDQRRGTWGSGGLMAGRAHGKEGDRVVSVREAIEVCCAR